MLPREGLGGMGGVGRNLKTKIYDWRKELDYNHNTEKGRNNDNSAMNKKIK